MGFVVAYLLGIHVMCPEHVIPVLSKFLIKAKKFSRLYSL
jgi:hypothetical protein